MADLYQISRNVSRLTQPRGVDRGSISRGSRGAMQLTEADLAAMPYINQAKSEFEEKRKKEEIRLAQRTAFSRLVYKFKSWVRRTFAPNVFDVMMNTSLAMQYVLAEASSRDADCVIHPVLPNAAWFELYKVEELIRRGEQETEKMLPQIKALMEE